MIKSRIAERMRAMKPGTKCTVEYDSTITCHAAMTNMIRNVAKRIEKVRNSRGARIFFAYKRPWLECVDSELFAKGVRNKAVEVSELDLRGVK